MPRRVRLKPQQVQRRVRDLSPGDVGFVSQGSVFATRPDLILWVFGDAHVEDEGLPGDVRIKKWKRGARVFAPAGMQFRLDNDHGPDDIPVYRLDFEEAEDEEKAGEP
jgi:hypothetical protein